MKRFLLLVSFLLVFPTAYGTAIAKEKTQGLSLEEKFFEIDKSDDLSNKLKTKVLSKLWRIQLMRRRLNILKK